MKTEEQQTVASKSAIATETRLKTLNQLKGSRVAIESFLERYVESQSTRIDALEGIEWLDRIVCEAALGNFDRQAIDTWMDRYRDLAQSTVLSVTDRKRISSLLLELQRHSTDSESKPQSLSDISVTGDTSDQIGANELRKRFEVWKERSGSVTIDSATKRINSDVVLPKSGADSTKPSAVTATGTDAGAGRKVVLRRKGENADTNLFERFTEQVWTELDLLYREFETDEHALIKLDELLKYAEAKTDPMYLHLAGSLIYFLKIEGFRMAPYAERLRRIEKRFVSSQGR